MQDILLSRLWTWLEFQISVLFILQNILKLKKISTRCVLHLLTEEQKCMCIKLACKLLKRIPRYNQKTFLNVVTNDESWIHFLKPH